MSRPLAKNRLDEWEKAALSQAIRRYALEHGGYSSLVRKARVRQPVISLALHRRLVARTKAVKRLFKYLEIDRSAAVPDEGEDAQARERRMLGLLAGLSDGSAVADERLETVLAALSQLPGLGARAGSSRSGQAD